MLRELYMRDPTDPLYTPDVLEQSSELETLLGQIRMIMFTKPGDVIGAYDFGYNLEDNLFLFDVSAEELRSRLIENVYFYCPDAAAFKVDIQAKFFKGTVRDACLLDIFIDNRKTLGVLVA
jgi:mRNA-degrading endonuclease HigB of HigAB toxin-antitoxin module